ncbi:MAG: cell envelope biogenesis protein TolA [Burkholderiales bacterium]|nr:cell envelope biogenesis protein TolA [Burkholderiales bacterium]
MQTVVSALTAAAVMSFLLSTAAWSDDVSKEAKRSADARYKAAVKAANSDYKIASAKCRQLTDNAKDVCIQGAKANQIKAKAEAKAARKSTSAKVDAQETARMANYKVAKEKCDALSGNAKDACIENAKAAFQQ